jgi:hypothetical protein
MEVDQVNPPRKRHHSHELPCSSPVTCTSPVAPPSKKVQFGMERPVLNNRLGSVCLDQFSVANKEKAFLEFKSAVEALAKWISSSTSSCIPSDIASSLSCLTSGVNYFEKLDISNSSKIEVLQNALTKMACAADFTSSETPLSYSEVLLKPSAVKSPESVFPPTPVKSFASVIVPPPDISASECIEKLKIDINPSTQGIAIKSVRPTRNGKILLLSSSPEVKAKLDNLLTEKQYEVAPPNERKFKFTITGIPSTMSKEEIF